MHCKLLASNKLVLDSKVLVTMVPIGSFQRKLNTHFDRWTKVSIRVYPKDYYILYLELYSTLNCFGVYTLCFGYCKGCVCGRRVRGEKL